MVGPLDRNGEKSMEQTSQDSPRLTAVSPLEAQIRECFGRVAYSHKTHEKCADIYQTRLSRVKFWQITLSALTTGGLIAVLFGPAGSETAAATVSALLSTGLLVLNTYTKDIDPGRLSERHRETASALWDIRESYLSLIADLRAGAIGEHTARQARDALQARLAEIYKAAPRTSDRAYQLAQQGLQKSEELTFTEAEIDQLLPPSLRLG